MDIPRRIFTLWLGGEPFPPHRKHAYDNLPEYKCLITADTVTQYVLAEYPLHPAYPLLSTIHKSDYLRCYLLHHYGGGYSDLKYTTIDWDNAFDTMNSSDICLMGVKTTAGHTGAGIEEWDYDLHAKIYKTIDKLICMGWFISRPRTPITLEWYTQLHQKLDTYMTRLLASPSIYTRECYHPGRGHALDRPDWEGVVDTLPTNYPLRWNILLGNILYPIQLKYIQSIDNTTMKHLL